MAAMRRPSALKHGLTSRTVRELWSPDVVRLAGAILGATPPEPRVVEAARAEAEAILHLRQVQQCRLRLLEDGTLKRSNPTEAERDLALKLSAAVKHGEPDDCASLRRALDVAHAKEWIVGVETAATIILEGEFSDRVKEHRRLAEYERRAISQRRKSLRRFDYEKIEAERQPFCR